MYFNTVHVKKAVALLSRLYWTCLSRAGIEPRPAFWQSSTLLSEPLVGRKNNLLFSTYIVNIRVHCMLNFHLL